MPRTVEFTDRMTTMNTTGNVESRPTSELRSYKPNENS
jgi:hypothetical protein